MNTDNLESSLLKLSIGDCKIEETVIVDSDDSFTCFEEQYNKIQPTEIVFDLEGVNLSRLGTVCVISVAFRSTESDTCHTYLFDILVFPQCIDKKLKEVFTDERVVKIIHDGRQDCDALDKLYHATVVNIHDTQILSVIHDNQTVSLNDLLQYHKLKPNHFRRKVYKDEPRFWAKRPMTQEMKGWAAGDIHQLFYVYEKQIAKYSVEKIRLLSEKRITEHISFEFVKKIRIQSNIGRVVGRGGSNFKNWEKQNKVAIYGLDGDDSKCNFYIMGHSKAALETTERSMHRIESSFYY